MQQFQSLTPQEFSQGYPPEKIFVTSDLHLYHTNIIKYCGRPFDFSPEGCAKMNEFLLKKFDALPDDCLIWNFGDVFMNLRIEEARIMNDIMRMKKNRKMLLIFGNHDFQTKKTPFKTYIEFFEHLGFDKVFKGPLLYGNMVLSHEPVFLDPKSDGGLFNIHGHTHEKLVTEDYFLSDFNKHWKKQKVNPAQYINVCVDTNRFELLKFSELLEKTT